MLHSTVHGQGEPLVFLHGFCSDQRIWDSFISPFAEEYQVILLDLPGCGKSEMADNDLTVWASACWNSLTQLGVQACHIVGHSMGGYVALEMMMQAPERFKSFTSFHSTPIADTEERRTNRMRQIEFIDKYGPKMLVRQIIPALFMEGVDNTFIDKAVRIAENQTGQGLQSALSAMANRSDNREMLFSADIPVLFLSGRYDGILPIADQEIFAQSCKRGLIRILENTAHMGMLEEKELAQEYLAKFVAGID